ncbi:uncharacterized protein [Dermacentor albipictus]|uniref:uncharacterized protein n=1 Tax=Dermacentor albipictus TaxID=60249 RepID=UPI0038FCFF13
MTGSRFRHEVPDAANVAVPGAASRIGGRRPLSLLAAAVLVIEAAEAFEVQDGQYFGIVNSSAPFAKVHLVMTESSRFVLSVDFTKDELYGEFSFAFLEPIKGTTLTPLTILK